MRYTFVFTLLLSLALAACGEQETNMNAATKLATSNAEIALSPVPGRPAAAYFTLTGDEKDRSLTKVDVAGAERVMLHETVETDGIASMQHIDAVALPAGETVVFERGGRHVMIFGLAEPLEGEAITMTLTFADGETLEVQAQPKKIGADTE